jgi:hypothetical protein
VKNRVVLIGLFVCMLVSISYYQYPVFAQEIVTPPARRSTFMVYDPHNQVSVLFGGVSSEGGLNALADTWLYSYATNTWTELDLAVNPSPRFDMRMVYCNATNEIIMFGGYGAPGTWSFDCATQTWSEVVTAISPGNHWSHNMAYDPGENVVIMFGGFSGEGTEGDDTWKFDCVTRQWSELSPSTTPLARYGHVMVYDESIQRIVLANGNTAYQGHQDDTWLYDAATNTWTEVDTTGTSGRLKWPAMVYDSINEKCILFGGQVGDDPVDETMIYDASTETWINGQPDENPQGRITHGLAFDSTHGVVVLFGGVIPEGDQLGDTWTYSFVENVWTDMSGEPTSTGTTSGTTTDTGTPPPEAQNFDFLILLITPGVLVVFILAANMVRGRKK